jgi:Flp pilus assembly pilin Flp
MSKIVRFSNPRRVRGQGMTEYIIIVALIAIAAIAVVSLFGGTVRSQVAGMAQEMSGTSASAQIGNAKQAAQKAANVANTTATKTNLGNYNKAGSEAVQ